MPYIDSEQELKRLLQAKHFYDPERWERMWEYGFRCIEDVANGFRPDFSAAVNTNVLETVVKALE